MGESSLEINAYGTLYNAILEILALPAISQTIGLEHTNKTPQRVCEAFKEYFVGCYQNPEVVLDSGFSAAGYDEMVYVNDISFVSFCCHHLSPFFGKVSFAYIPKKKIVGLSKIPRLVEIYAKRPQVQEKLGQEIVNTFQKVVQPKGCGVVIEAMHLCMAIRGIKKDSAITKTTALKGCFARPAVKAEFLDGIKTGGNIWP